MAEGISTAAANSFLDSHLNGLYIQLHTGTPGPNGTDNVSATTARQALTFASAASGSKAISAAPQWDPWAVSDETLSHISLWTASSGGTFKHSVAVSTSRAVTTGNVVKLNTLAVTQSPRAS